MKSIFFVTPIGSEGSTQRIRSDQVMRHILGPSLSEEFEIIRADQVEHPDDINRDVIRRLNDSDLVVADLSGQNPNVMYEVGIRHALNKPIVTICEEGQKYPFDLVSLRHISYDLTNPDKLTETREKVQSFCDRVLKEKSYQGPVARVIGQGAFDDMPDLASQALETIHEKLDYLTIFYEQLDDQISSIGDDRPEGVPEATLDKIDEIYSLVCSLRPWEAEDLIRKLRNL